ncbi:MAG: tetratricopeptide repeat protein [Armatimonadetes bacterium]|nr:tetratricopeptide repeat protein [Armatimonadota bacterium]MDW8121801.1 tetratricopeptide repeat protein [Armatimonadota bacterium]
MQRGDDQVIACPHCEALAKHFTLISGNTFGARLWTDGKMIAPMLPEPPPFVQCHQCRHFYWLSDARKVGLIPVMTEGTTGFPDDWLNAPYVQEPSEDAYYQALSEQVAETLDEEKFLRVLALWKRNDSMRDLTGSGSVEMQPLSDQAKQNLETLVSLLDESHPDEGLLKAEVLRELGQFDEARQTLQRVSSDDYQAIVQVLLFLCDQGDTMVREIG